MDGNEAEQKPQEVNNQLVLPSSSRTKGYDFSFDFQEVDLMCLRINNPNHMKELIHSCMSSLREMDFSSIPDDDKERIEKSLKLLDQELESLRITSITRNNVVRL